MNKNTGFNVSHIFLAIAGVFVLHSLIVRAARVRDLFEQARQQAPAIIFIDELDALGRARGAHPMAAGHDEKEQTLNQLLVELDGFDSGSGLVLLAATNRPEVRDPALLRAGRFDRQVLVDRPDKSGRAAILRVHMKKVAVDANVEVEQVAALTPGFTGAETAREIDCSVRKIVDKAHGRAAQILERNRTLLEEGSRDLLAKETMPEQDLKALFSRVQAWDGAAG